MTTESQDRELVDWLNARENVVRFNLLWRNCADFARDVVHVAYPGAIRTRAIADLGITTPKAIARSLVKHVRATGAELVAFVVPQIPGSRPHSGKARGILEGVVKTKKYVVPLAFVQPVDPRGDGCGLSDARTFRSPSVRAGHHVVASRGRAACGVRRSKRPLRRRERSLTSRRSRECSQ
ncbi:MAG: hypothetical protein QM736_15570 [Vicinamibacterales bacterium]